MVPISMPSSLDKFSPHHKIQYLRKGLPVRAAFKKLMNTIYKNGRKKKKEKVERAQEGKKRKFKLNKNMHFKTLEIHTRKQL